MKHFYTHIIALVFCMLLSTAAIAQDNGSVKVNAPKGLATRNNNQLGKKSENKQSEAKPAAPKTQGQTPQKEGTTTAKPKSNGEKLAKRKNDNGGTSQPQASQKPTRERTNQQSVARRSTGFRIQAFSDNNHATARAQAQSRAKAIAMKFPQYRSYISYNAPSWRLRIGDFQKQQDAKAAIASIRKAFPSFARELTIVRDHINVWQ